MMTSRFSAFSWSATQSAHLMQSGSYAGSAPIDGISRKVVSVSIAFWVLSSIFWRTFSSMGGAFFVVISLLVGRKHYCLVV